MKAAPTPWISKSFSKLLPPARCIWVRNLCTLVLLVLSSSPSPDRHDRILSTLCPLRET